MVQPKKKSSKKKENKKSHTKQDSKKTEENTKKEKIQTKHSKSRKKEKSLAHKTTKHKNVKKEVSSRKEENISDKYFLTILAVVFAILVAITASFFMYKSYFINVDNNLNNNNNEKINNNNIQETQEAVNSTANNENLKVKLLVVEDPSCVKCQVDQIIEQLKDKLLPNLEVEKVDFKSEKGKEIVNSLNLNQVPVFFFSEEISKLDIWEQQLKPAFQEEILNGETYYMLNPALIQNKVLLKAPEILEGSIIVGNPNAKVALIVFDDFQCPFCAIAEGNKEKVEQFSSTIPGYKAPMPNVYENYIKNGTVKLVFYNFPLEQIHPYAKDAANAGLCVYEQDNNNGEIFNKFKVKMYDNQDEWATSDFENVITKYVKELGLDVDKFKECYSEKRYDEQITKELELGEKYGVSGTPTFFIGRKMISGAQPYEVFEEAIKAELNS